MAYKRFFYRKGKKFGPYYYESYRDDNGKVKKRYVGTVDPDNIITDHKEDAIKDNISNEVSKVSTRFNLAILFILIAILILTDFLFLIFY